MDKSTDVSDPTDWTDTSLPAFVPVDAALRCQVCKDFFDNAVITTCAHTFCSLCIRRCLAADGRCPSCRSNEQDVRLRRNVAVQEITDAFKAARLEALKLARRSTVDETVEHSGRETRGQKRKRQAQDDHTEHAPRRSRRLKSNEISPPAITIPDSDEELEDEKDKAYREKTPEGFAHCPICQNLMKAELVFDHVVGCEFNNEASKSNRRSSRNSASSRSQTNTPLNPLQSQPAPPPRPPPERLPQLNYSLLKDNALRKKLSELGISSSGARPLLIRRHTEWINLWNANCDSARPKSRKELLSELDAWERSQGGRAIDGGQGSGLAKEVMRKDFDGDGWVKKNKGDFDQLIEDARKKRGLTIKPPTNAGPEDMSSARNSMVSPTSSRRQSITTNHSPQKQHPPLTLTTSVSSTDRPSPPSIFSPPNAHRLPFSQLPDGPATTLPTTTPSLLSPPHNDLPSRPTPSKSPVPGFSFEKSLNHSHEAMAIDTEPSVPVSIVSPPQVQPPTPVDSTPRANQSPVPGFSFEKSQHYLHKNENAPEATAHAHAGSRSFGEETQPAHVNGHGHGRGPSAGASEHGAGMGFLSPPMLRRASGSESSLPGRLASPEGIVRRKPMFEVPGDPVEDSEVGTK